MFISESMSLTGNIQIVNASVFTYGAWLFSLGAVFSAFFLRVRGAHRQGRRKQELSTDSIIEAPATEEGGSRQTIRRDAAKCQEAFLFQICQFW